VCERESESKSVLIKFLGCLVSTHSLLCLGDPELRQ